jgi:RNA polymerase sigma-70 factor, ECF subfamily
MSHFRWLSRRVPTTVPAQQDEPETMSINQRHQPSTGGDRSVEAVWRAHHDYAHGIARRVLGDHAAAEDAVQEAFSRLAQADVESIDDVRGWLTVVVRHVALDHVRSAHHRRETTTAFASGEPQPPAAAIDPLDRITLDDEVQIALGLVLDRLTPPERTAFVLHDVFGFPFEAVAEIVGRSPAAVRQLASRARRSIRSSGGPPDPAPDELRQLAERFVSACDGGDLAGLMELLDPAIEGTGTQIGHGPVGHFRGRRAVARGLLQFIGPDTDTVLVPVALEQNLAIVALRHGAFAAVVRIETAGGLIRKLHSYIRFADGAGPQWRGPTTSRDR